MSKEDETKIFYLLIEGQGTLAIKMRADNSSHAMVIGNLICKVLHTVYSSDWIVSEVSTRKRKGMEYME